MDRRRDARARNVSLPALAERQLAYLVWRLAPDNLQDTLAEFALLVDEFGACAQHALLSELQRAASERPVAHQALQQCTPWLSPPMFSPLPDVTAPSLPPDASGAAILDAALDQLARSRQASAPQTLSPFLAQFLTEPSGDGPALAPLQRQQIFLAAHERVGAEVLSQALLAAVPKLPL